MITFQISFHFFPSEKPETTPVPLKREKCCSLLALKSLEGISEQVKIIIEMNSVSLHKNSAKQNVSEDNSDSDLIRLLITLFLVLICSKTVGFKAEDLLCDICTLPFAMLTQSQCYE